MTEPPPNWTSPTGDSGQQTGAGPAPVFDPSQNWGLAAPRMTYAVLVPRPPRPTTFTVATALALIGVVISLILQAASGIYEWTNRDKLFASAIADAPPGVDGEQLIKTSATIGLVLGIVLYVLVAAGVVVCVILARKKKNPARIVLAVLLGVAGLNNLCGVAAGAALSSLGDRLSQGSSGNSLTFSAMSADSPWWTLAGTGVLAALALTAFVLLIVPPTNRYFSAGAGRRFIPET